MFDYLEFQAFGPGEILDLYSTSTPACMLEEQDQDLSAFFPELMEADWQQHRCSQCRWKPTFRFKFVQVYVEKIYIEVCMHLHDRSGLVLLAQNIDNMFSEESRKNCCYSPCCDFYSPWDK